MRIGILALQGDFAEHRTILQSLGVESSEVRLPPHLEGLDGLIIPGGESTTIGKLAIRYGLWEPLREFGRQKAIWGTCAGAILLSSATQHSQPLLNLMDMTVARNAFGSQIESFEVDLKVPVLHQLDTLERPFHSIFIRAPLIESVGAGVQVLARLASGRIVAAQQGHLMATSFHPELTTDTRFHRYFLSSLRKS